MDFGPPFSLFPTANQQPYMAQQTAAYPASSPSYRNISFSRNDAQVASSSSNLNAAAPGAFPGGSTSVLPQSSYRAPAHRHAHHLHSIPPREKSTRTLIIDHMLWVHARTRFAQARAELGMTDRTGGPESPNYVHRTRPESYEEEDEEGSEGEEAFHLKARSGNGDDEEERLGRQSLSLARSLRVRAEGLEKVVISMLEQPPPVIHPFNDQDLLTPPTSPKSSAPAPTDPHRLPNGVRLRLALGTIINDLFARQAPHPPYRHTHPPNVKISTPSEHSSSVPPTPSDLPHALAKLAPVSGAFAHTSHAPSHTIPARSTRSPQYAELAQSYSSMPYQTLQQSFAPQSASSSQRPHPSPRTRSLYAVGADPSTANSPPAFRCPRHLHTGCEICVEAKSPGRHTGGSSSRGRASSFGGSDRNNASNSWKAMPGGVGPGGGGITGWQDGTGIGSGLLRPGVRGSALRRKVREEGDAAAGGGNSKLSKLLPRFIRLSALVAAELGREVRGEDGESDDGKEGERDAGQGSTSPAVPPQAPATIIPAGTPGRWTPPPSPAFSRASLHNQNSSPAQSHERQQRRMYEYALRPSSEWYMLLAGLLTRAVLEGYLTAGWTGLQAVQCLLLVGLGINENATKERDEDHEVEEVDDDDEFASLDPDELPNLVDAIKVLFPSLRDNGSGAKSKAEEEYEAEMFERLNRFYDIPASTPDCATHMEDIAWQYPAEPVERAAVRFCEAIAKWRGKPELETYKKKPADISSPGGSTGMTIESLVHSNPTSPMMANASSSTSNGPQRGQRKLKKKPSIDVYFLQPPGGTRRESGTWARNANKRYRDADDAGRPQPAKRMYA